MHFLQVLLIAVFLFGFQLAYAAWVQSSVLTAKSTQIALQTLKGLLNNPVDVAWVVYYLCLGVLAHALMIGWGLLVHRRLVTLFPKLDQRGMRVLLVALLFWAVSLINAAFFPNAAIHLQTLGSAGLWVGVVIVSAYLLVLASSFPRTALGAALCGGLWAVFSSVFLPLAGETRTQPDVIIIGVDSLRYDHVHKQEGQSPLMPAVSRFVEQSVEFRQAFTPMGRTYVSYTSLLTGKYPVNHGVRENLFPQDMLDRSWLLPAALSELGYTPVLALDESRFANLDVNFGFEVNALPPSGALDFILAGSMDSQATNALQLLPGGWRLMPHVAGNRAGHTAYNPMVHARRVASAVNGVPESKPLFLLSHYCVAHTPFWKGEVGPVTDSLPEYAAALKVADQQVDQLLTELEHAGRLDNAIVILMSDHGEGLGLDSDAIVNAHGVSQSHYGHGYPVYDLNQSHVLLSIQHYINGEPSLPASKDDRLVSLVDVAPTIMNLLGQPFNGADGLSLIGHGANEQPVDRYVYVESGIFGPSLQRRNINPGEVVEAFAGMYKLGEDGRFSLADETLKFMYDLKQRMAIGSSSIYVWLPGCDDSGCVYEYDRVNKKLQSVAGRDAAMNAICGLFNADLPVFCGRPVVAKMK